MTDNIASSQTSIANATRSRANFSGHGNSKGAAGYIDPNDQDMNVDFLGRRDDSLSVSPPPEGFGNIRIAAAWDNQQIADTSFLGKLLKKTKPADIDLDLGILYELQDGQKGAIQAFGDDGTMGHYNTAPYLSLSGDERTGNSPDDDEFIHVNGQEWPKFKRLLIYVYIYRGALDWAQVKPQIHIHIPGQKPMIVTLSSHHKGLGLCTIAGIENIRNGMRIQNFTEYFPGHAEMDRAFGFGLEWTGGEKS